MTSSVTRFEEQWKPVDRQTWILALAVAVPGAFLVSLWWPHSPAAIVTLAIVGVAIAIGLDLAERARIRQIEHIQAASDAFEARVRDVILSAVYEVEAKALETTAGPQTEIKGHEVVQQWSEGRQKDVVSDYRAWRAAEGPNVRPAQSSSDFIKHIFSHEEVQISEVFELQQPGLAYHGPKYAILTPGNVAKVIGLSTSELMKTILSSEQRSLFDDRLVKTILEVGIEFKVSPTFILAYIRAESGALGSKVRAQREAAIGVVSPEKTSPPPPLWGQ
jgi:hypothetical protein